MTLAALDPQNRVGALLHALLPDARIDPFSADSLAFNPYKYITTGVSLYLRHVFDMGASHQSLLLFAIGGADLIPDDTDIKLGYRNIVALRRTLWQEGVLLYEHDFGGDTPRSVELNMSEETVFVTNRKKGRTAYGT